MKQRLLYGLLALVLVGIGVDSYFITSSFLSGVAAKDTRKSAIVRLVDMATGKTFCSGTVVSEHTVLTAAHCVELRPSFMAGFPEPVEIRGDDNSYLGVLALPYYITGQLDQALLGGDFKQFKQLKLVTDPKELSTLRSKKTVLKSCGFPMGGSLFCSDATYVRSDGFAWLLNGVLIPGMSGGPTFNSDGDVVADNVAVEAEYSVVSPLYNINDKIKDYESGK